MYLFGSLLLFIFISPGPGTEGGLWQGLAEPISVPRWSGPSGAAKPTCLNTSKQAVWLPCINLGDILLLEQNVKVLVIQVTWIFVLHASVSARSTVGNGDPGKAASFPDWRDGKGESQASKHPVTSPSHRRPPTSHGSWAPAPRAVLVPSAGTRAVCRGVTLLPVTGTLKEETVPRMEACVRGQG